MTRMTSRRWRMPALLAAAALVASCGGGDKPASHALPTNGAVSPTATPSPTPTPTPSPKLVSPFTGLAVDALKPVIAVKVDNATLARPQWGLEKADIVYEEAVEGRQTRFIAIYSSQEAPQIGPVRSVRESDIPLLRQFGKVAFAFSGGNRGVLSSVRSSGAVYEVSYNNRSSAYTVAGRRRDAFNYVTSSKALLAHAPQAALAKDIGFRFGDAARSTKPGTYASLTWSRYARTSWQWSPRKKTYLRYMDSAPAMLRSGGQQSAHTVVIQYCTVRSSRYSDVSGAKSPYTTTVGSGKVVVLRGGKAYYGTWKRNGTGPTRFLDAKGKDIPLATGPVWVMLAPRDLSAKVS